MKICYVLPGLGVSGGIRVVFQHAKFLAARGHQVDIVSPEVGRPTWYDLPGAVTVIGPGPARSREWDVVVATGWETVVPAVGLQASRHFYFVQMMEHLFFANGSPEYNKALASYQLAFRAGVVPITIADWLATELSKFGFDSLFTVPNGIEMDVFSPGVTREPYILIEGDDRNYAKDQDGISWRVAQGLRQRYALRVLAFAGVIHQYAPRMDTFIYRPPDSMMRQLYGGALFLLKASRYEGRSLSPLEALACGTPVCRGIIAGDDDITDAVGRRVGYDYNELFSAACEMIENLPMREKVTEAALDYAQAKLRWAPIIDTLEVIYGGNA